MLDVPKKQADLYFVIVTITSPITGAVVSSQISSCIGGHESPKTLPICIVCSIIGVLSALPFPIVNTGLGAVIIVWILLFNGGIILPMLYGVLLSTVPEDQRPTANSLANLSYNLLGYAPAPLLYGLVDQLSSSDKPRIGATMLMYMSFAALFFVVFSY